MKLIPNYISLEEYPYKKRQQFYPKVLWVRSIHPIYNPEMAIDVIAQLNQDHPQVKLCMVGPVKDKALFDKLQEKIRVLQLEDCIQFTGQLSKNKWSAIARDYDIFINTSNIDNTPVSIMEAMALGLPIVSTNVGGIPYLIDDGVTGLLINSSDSDQMAEKINELISGKIDGDFITRNARQRISIMDKKEIIKKWYDIIDDAVLYIK